jgi:drug/metabolite transporter (DMT)-like permease
MEANSFLGGERNPISWSGAPNGGRTVCTLTGPTCDDGDILQGDVELPNDLGLGDRVYIGTAGAYSTSLAVNFNGFAPPESFVRSRHEPPSVPRPAIDPTRRRRELGLIRLSRESLGLAAVLLSALLWAASANVAESLYASGVGSLQVAGAESVIAAICLFAWRLKRRGGRARTTLSIRQRLLLGTSLTLMVTTYYGAIEMLEVGSAVVLHYSAPVLVVLWTLLRMRQPPKFKVTASLGLAAIGILLVTQLLVTGFGTLNPAGVMVALASAAFLAAYTLLSDAAIRTATPLEVTTETFLWAAPLSVVAFLGGAHPQISSPPTSSCLSCSSGSSAHCWERASSCGALAEFTRSRRPLRRTSNRWRPPASRGSGSVKSCRRSRVPVPC